MTAGAAAPVAPRFLCDEMLGRLARYLRAAGYDTTLAAAGAADRDLVAAARDGQRILLTCDRRIAEHKAAAGVAAILRRGDLDTLARQVGERCGVDWLHRPFSRCLVDNAPLAAAAVAHRARVPADVAALPVLACPECGRVYWAGSHHRRMRARLQRWHAGAYERDAPA